MSEENKTCSIAWHLRRVIHEDAYVAVPVTDAVMKTNDDGTSAIDFEALIAQAVRIGQSAGVDWQVEETDTQPHPMQGPLPEGRRMFDAFYAQNSDTT